MNAANAATSFYIPRICKRWMPHDIQAKIVGLGANVIRVDIVPIVRPESSESESFIDRLDKEHHSAFVYFDAPIDYSAWGNGLKGGKQTRVYTGCWMTPVKGVDARPFNEFWVLIPNNPRSVIPFTTKTTTMLEQELSLIQPKNARDMEIWKYNLDCVRFHKVLNADAPVDICQERFDDIYCAWLSIHQVAANIERLAERVERAERIINDDFPKMSVRA